MHFHLLKNVPRKTLLQRHIGRVSILLQFLHIFRPFVLNKTHFFDLFGHFGGFLDGMIIANTFIGTINRQIKQNLAKFETDY